MILNEYSKFYHGNHVYVIALTTIALCTTTYKQLDKYFHNNDNYDRPTKFDFAIGTRLLFNVYIFSFLFTFKNDLPGPQMTTLVSHDFIQ